MASQQSAGAAVVSLLSTPRETRLDPAFWRGTAVAAALRTASNQSRAQHRDRGTLNAEVDQQGVAGELVGLKAVTSVAQGSSVEFTLVDWDGAVDEADLVVEEALRLETKCHFDRPGYSKFMINSMAHDKAERRGASAYLPVVTRYGSSLAVTGRLIPISEVDRWRINPRPRRTPPFDPAREVHLKSLCPQVFGRPWKDLRDALRQSAVIETSELNAVYRGAFDAFPQLEQANIPLKNLAYPAIIDQLSAIEARL